MPDTATISKLENERAWALGMNQAEFDLEWQRKFPTSDFIPDVNGYVSVIPVEDRSMTPFNPDELENEDGPQKTIQEPTVDEMTCPGCGYLPKTDKKTGKPSRIGLMSHMRHCKKKMDKEAMENG